MASQAARVALPAATASPTVDVQTLVDILMSPDDQTPNGIICPLWDDLYPPQAGASVKIGTVGSAPNRKLVVSRRSHHDAHLVIAEKQR